MTRSFSRPSLRFFSASALALLLYFVASALLVSFAQTDPCAGIGPASTPPTFFLSKAVLFTLKLTLDLMKLPGTASSPASTP